MMKTHALLATAGAVLLALAGCGQPQNTPEVPVETQVPATEAADADKGQFSEAGTQTELAPISLEPFTIGALHIGELRRGHFNLYVEGGEPAVVRAWVGDEAATDVVVTLAEFEVNHHCAHIEVPEPLPADAALWVEIETSDGARLKGSTPVQ
jgi:hypothetical protein